MARIVARDCGQIAVIADNAVIADISFIAEIGSAAVCYHPGKQRYELAFPITGDLPITRSPDPR